VSRRGSRLVVLILAAVTGALVTGCAGNAPAHRQTASSTHARPAPWVDQPVSFTSDGMTIYGTFRRPASAAAKVPAVVLIAGSGPADRNGDAPGMTLGSLRAIADWLSADGVATLRYDKLASGQTGLGPYATRPGEIDLTPFEREATAALRFLGTRPQVDADHLGVFGHSEGGLFALLLVTGAAGATPPIHALGLIEPLPERYLDILGVQLGQDIDAALKRRQVTAATARRYRAALRTAIADVRRTGTIPASLPRQVVGNLASNTRFLRQADRHDPAALGARLPRGTPVLLTCSDADIQVTCPEVDRLAAGLQRGHARLRYVRLRGVDHILKQDPSRTSAHYTEPLPFSPQLRGAIAAFVRTAL
jgi:hypothetical protein